uniref:Uncharacterized protein n=1 Tax=Geoglobus ahangari TaxID=113653 RepID=A0A7C3UIW0_9EURY
MQYVIEVEKSLARRIEELDDLILNAIEWYLNSDPKVVKDDVTRIIPRLCSVIDKEVIQIDIPDDLWVRLRKFGEKNRLRIDVIIKEAIKEYIYRHHI